MYRIDNATAAAALPTPAAVGENPDGFFTSGDLEGGIPATIVDADWANAIQEEVCAVIEGAGITLDKTTQSQMYNAILLLISGSSGSYAASTTAANTYTATLSPAPLAYAAGQTIRIKFTNHNTGAATINLNALGAKSIKRLDGSALSAYDIYDGMMAILVYDGTNFILINPYLRFGIQNEESNYAASTTAANTYTTTVSPTPAAYTTGMRFSIKFSNTNTGAATLNVNSLGAKSIVLTDGSALVGGEIPSSGIADLRYDGTNLQLLNVSQVPVQNQRANYTTSTTAANTYTATLTPAPSAYAAGQRFSVKFTNKNTGAATINFNSLGAKSIVRKSGAALVGNEIADGMVAELVYDGTNFQLENPAPIAPQRTVYTSGSGTYTTPVGAIALRVRMIGGGGGGQGATAAGANTSPTAGGNTTFGALTAGGGGVGGAGYNAGAGGTASGADINLTGETGHQGSQNNGSGTISQIAGGRGGAGALGGAGLGGAIGLVAGGAAPANSGGGGGGGGTNNTASYVSGGGGGAGGYCEHTYTSPASSYSYAVGAGGNAGTTGAGANGGAGAAGIIIVDAFFQ